MKNKLGLTGYLELEEAEKFFVSQKLQEIEDEDYFFKAEIDLAYIENIHRYLFHEIYYEDQLKIRKVYRDNNCKEIYYLIKKIKAYPQNSSYNLKELQNLFYTLWERQLFYDGNSRTTMAFLKIFLKRYNIPFEIKNHIYLQNISHKKL